jgi:hypothetical protein
MAPGREPESVARNLTADQRRALLWLPSHGAAPVGKDSPWALRDISHMVLCTSDQHGRWWKATAFGSEVRAALRRLMVDVD